MFYKVIAAISAATTLCLMPCSALAESQGLLLEANIAEVSEITGAEVGVGWRLGAGNFRLTPAVGAFIYQGDNDRYRMYEQSNGARCRDTTNGQYAKTAQCDDTAMDAYGRIEATYQWRKIEIGAGYRVADSDSAPYGTLAYRIADTIAIKGNFGSDYVGVGLALRGW